METLAVTLALLLFGHALADYPLQGDLRRCVGRRILTMTLNEKALEAAAFAETLNFYISDSDNGQ